MKKIFVLTALFVIAVSAHSTIKSVPVQYSTIQAAINASANGDTVLVEPGTYTENINFRGKNIVLTSHYYQTNNPSIIWSTIINGGSPVYPDTASCVIINNHEDSTAVLQGFAITGGSGTRWEDEHGAGSWYREGGGILIQYSSPVIQNNIIFNNLITNLTNVTSTGGGGMRIGDSYPRIYNNVIYSNTGKYGAGVVFNYSGCDFKNNIVCSNYGSESYGAGAGIWINNNFTRPRIIENNTITNNTAASGCGGIYQFAPATTTFRNNIIWGNTSTNNLQIQGGTLLVTYSDIQGGFTGVGNINFDPVFADSSYILQILSPCIDKGDTSAIYNDPPDPGNPSFALYPSRGLVRNDMGAYGGPRRKVLTNQLIGIHQISGNFPKNFSLKQNYPNPFNPSANIKYQISKNSFVTLAIYNILGEELTKLVNENQKPGTYEVNWNAENFPSGAYFYKLSSESFSDTKKMILVK